MTCVVPPSPIRRNSSSFALRPNYHLVPVGVRDVSGGDPLHPARVWALPFLSALAPCERYAAKRGKRHNKKITEWAWGSCSCR